MFCEGDSSYHSRVFAIATTLNKNVLHKAFPWPVKERGLQREKCTYSLSFHGLAETIDTVLVSNYFKQLYLA